MIPLGATDIRAFIPAKDFESSLDFYVSLGFSLAWSDANLALLEMANQRFYLQRYYVKDWADNSMLHLTVADADHCYRKVSEMLADGRFPEARVAQPKQESYGALVTYVWDPCGVLLHLAQWTSQ